MSTRSHTDIESWELPDGGELFIDFDDRAPGSNDPFYAVYRRPDRTGRYGWFCSRCESVDVAMDSMEAIECTRCGNHRKPTRWDAVYL